MLPPVARKQFQALDCLVVAGESVLRVDTAVNCSSAEFRRFQVVVSLMMTAFLAIPMAWATLLCSDKGVQAAAAAQSGGSSSNSGSSSSSSNPGDDNSSTSSSPLKFLYGPYKAHLYYFECLELYRRIIFIGQKSRRKILHSL